MNWHGIPEELDSDIKLFMMEHHISFSSGYIGMLRIYWKRKDGYTGIAETSRLIPIIAAMTSTPTNPISFPSDESLKEQGIGFVRWLMSLPSNDLSQVLHEDTDEQIKRFSPPV